MKLKQSFCIWFTGLPSSGKTTTALALLDHLRGKGLLPVHLDGDLVRKGLSADLGLSEKDREENNRRVIHVSDIIVRNGVPVISSFISPYRSTRKFARETIPTYIEVFVDTPIAVCIARDVKGLYAKALKGEIKGMTGIDSPYEKPVKPEIVLDSVNSGLEKNIDKIVGYLKKNKLIA